MFAQATATFCFLSLPLVALAARPECSGALRPYCCKEYQVTPRGYTGTRHRHGYDSLLEYSITYTGHRPPGSVKKSTALGVRLADVEQERGSGTEVRRNTVHAAIQWRSVAYNRTVKQANSDGLVEVMRYLQASTVLHSARIPPTRLTSTRLVHEVLGRGGVDGYKSSKTKAGPVQNTSAK
ncbi:hypothetical protein FPV67DRAFT_1729506 [Lyophyllum atratum]|nr:hypothetical protein FPV67DRAFT_1729506 [Lyophyllum atratum]